MRKVVVSWVSCNGWAVRDLVSEGPKVGKSWKKLGGFGEKLRLFEAFLVVFGAFLRGDFQECAQPRLLRLPILTGQKDSPQRARSTQRREDSSDGINMMDRI